ncbi:glycosyltransferase [Xanthobacteraceae bacterium Astr-EGSB]|uniref:CgeB family protein n=1 Tax=Astrobacterium formosum TaxID=3069710 RepID=UPI0027B86685|nr:glycosyltransferase [Xanthobacteraceae bacterium Astr-EGSB]
MKIVVFGLTISSSWGNGHATLWRGLCRALAQAGHRVVFFERDVPYYAGARDLTQLPGGTLVLYGEWDDVRGRARAEVRDADAVIVTSYCPDARAATTLACAEARGVRTFYDLDSAVTLARVTEGGSVPYIGPRGLADFDLVLSFTGGAALTEMRTRLKARRVVPLYGHVDPDMHRPAAPQTHYDASLSYLGTYSADRQDLLNTLLIKPARARPAMRFLIGGAQYPSDFPWSANIYFVRHLPPDEHPAFFSSSRLTLNITRPAMAAMGWCPSGRLFEAAACGTPILSDNWPGLGEFFAPGEEILIADGTPAALVALDLDDRQLVRIGRAGRERVLSEHTSQKRAAELIDAIQATPPGIGALDMMEA